MSHPTPPTTPPAPRSPRTAALSTTQGLAELAAGVNAEQAATRARLATSAPHAGSSGLIDVAAMQSDSVALGALWARTPALVGSRLAEPTPTPTPAPGPSPGLLYGAIGLLGGAAVVLGMLALRTPQTVVVEQPSTTPPSLAVSEVETSRQEGDATVRARPPILRRSDAGRATDPTGPETAIAVAIAPTPVASPATPARGTGLVGKKRARKTPRSSKSVKKAVSAPKPTTPSAKPAPPKAVTPAPRPGDTSVECILDPASCRTPVATKKPLTPKPAAARPALPEKLSMAALRKGLAGPKRAAKLCGSMHALPAGTKVRVKLSIGGSGKVISATALAPYANDAGRCVADKLADAEFEPFAKPVMGLVYGVRM